MRNEIMKLRCSKGEKRLVEMLTDDLSSQRKGEKVAYSEVIRIAIYEKASKQFGEEMVKQVLEKPL